MIKYLYSDDIIGKELIVVPLYVVKIDSFIHEVPNRDKRMSFNIFFRGIENGIKFKKNTLYRGHTWNDTNDLDFNQGMGALQNCFNDYFPQEIKQQYENEALQAREEIPIEMIERRLGNTWFYASKNEAENISSDYSIEDFLNPPTI